MRKEISDYIGKVLCCIHDKDFFQDITDELIAHIEDRTKYYTDSGYDIDEAEKRALERMGNPRIVGEKMNQLYNYKLYNIIGWLMLPAIAIVFIASWFSAAFSPDSLSSNSTDALALSISSICLVLLAIIYNFAFISRKRALMFSCGIAHFIAVYFKVGLLDISIFSLDFAEKSIILFVLSPINSFLLFVGGILALACSSELYGIINCTISEKVECVYSGLKSKSICVSIIMIIINFAFFLLYLKGVIK